MVALIRCSPNCTLLLLLLFFFCSGGLFIRRKVIGNAPKSKTDVLPDGTLQHIRQHPPFRCVEVLAIDRDKLRGSAESSKNVPPSSCDKLVLQRKQKAKSWRRATWSKLDVLDENPALLSDYDFLLVRDIDTKVNTSYVMRTLMNNPERGFIIGYVQNQEEAPCEELTAVTNWFAFWKHNRLVNRWRKSGRIHHDQYVFNHKFKPCCMEDVLCVDKCVKGLNEIHCRRQMTIMKKHYGNQSDCIQNRTSPNPSFYGANGNYKCRGEIGHWQDW